TPSAATQRLMSQWAGCITQDLFDAADMANQWGNMTATNNQRCASGHGAGAEGYIATTDRTFFFDTISQNKYYMLQYFAVSGLDNPSTAMMVINTKSFLGVSQGQDPHREHPRFNATDNAGMTALQSFYDKTMAAVTAAGAAGGGQSKLAN